MAWPLLIAAGVAAAGAIAGGVTRAKAASKAGNKQQQAIDDAMNVQRDMYDAQLHDQSPYLNAGQTTLTDMMRAMRAGEFDTQIDPSQIANDPGFQFRMAEGQKALQRSAAARGLLNSGGTLQALTRYGQGVASEEYGNAWQRDQLAKQGRFNRMSGIADMGQHAASNMGAVRSQYGATMADLYAARGNSEAARTIGVGNAWAGGIQGVTGAAASAIGGFGGGGGGGGMAGGGFMSLLGGAGGGGGSQPIPTQNQRGMPSANFGLDYSKFGGSY